MKTVEEERKDASKKKEYTAKVVLIGVFLSVFLLFIGYMTFFGPGWNALKVLSPLELVILALSTYRLGRLVAYDRVFEPFRRFFTDTVPDPTGEGDTVEAKGIGFQQSIGQLLCCPICAGTWVAAGLTYLLYLFPGPMHVFLTMTAAIGAGELLNAMTEYWSWGGQYSRTMSGAQALARREREQLKREHAERIEKSEEVYVIDPRIDSYVLPEEWRKDH